MKPVIEVTIRYRIDEAALDDVEALLAKYGAAVERPAPPEVAPPPPSAREESLSVAAALEAVEAPPHDAASCRAETCEAPACRARWREFAARTRTVIPEPRDRAHVGQDDFCKHGLTPPSVCALCAEREAELDALRNGKKTTEAAAEELDRQVPERRRRARRGIVSENEVPPEIGSHRERGKLGGCVAAQRARALPPKPCRFGCGFSTHWSPALAKHQKTCRARPLEKEASA